MIVIDNRTDLSYVDIGNVIDNYFESSIGETNYYGKNEYFAFETHKKIYKCLVNHGKTRLKFIITSIKNN